MKNAFERERSPAAGESELRGNSALSTKRQEKRFCFQRLHHGSSGRVKPRATAESLHRREEKVLIGYCS